MRFKCGPPAHVKAARREAALREWHPWFALRPVRIGDECVWLETIERRAHYVEGGWHEAGYWRFEFRLRTVNL